MKVTRNDTIRSIADTLNITMKEATTAYNAVWAAIENAAVNSTSITVPLGTFKKVGRNARIGRNPKTGARIQVAPSTSIVFRPSKGFKACLNQ